MIIDIDKCIGCGSCVRACSQENHVPAGYFRTWVERYQVEEGKQPHGGLTQRSDGRLSASQRART